MPIIVNLGAKVIPILLAAIFGINILTFNPSQDFQITITNHKVYNDGVEYRGIMQVENKKEEFTTKIDTTKHQGSIKFEKRRMKIEYSGTGNSEFDQQMIEKIYKEIGRYHGRKGLIGRAFDRVKDSINTILKRN